jgi:tRNA modification GTPase
LITSTGVELISPLPRHFLDTAGFRTVLVSAKTGEGMELLKEVIAAEAGSITEFDEPEASTSRWIACLEGCLDRLKSARSAIASGLPHEAVCLDLRDALYSLSELTGDTTADDIIGMVFEKFCIGK